MKEKILLLKNTFFLYILTFSGYFFNLITIPYQTRVLGVEYYGKIGFALAVMTYFQLFLDYGFILSATADIAKHKDDNQKISRITSSVFGCKLLLSIIGILLLFALGLFVPMIINDIELYLLYYISYILNAFMPDFLYRGFEQMKIITYRSVLIRFFFVVMIFVFVHNKSDYHLIPLMNLIGNLIALIVVWKHAIKTFKIKMVIPLYSEIVETMKKSTPYFGSRIISTVYSATNTVLIGLLYPTGPIVGLFSSADKLITTARSCFSPIADSLYPYMVKNKDFKLIKKILFIFMPIIISGCILVGLFSTEICILLFGEEFKNAGIMFALMLPIVVIYLPTYILAFPTLEPMGLSKYANMSNFLGAFFHLFILSILFVTENLNVYSICIAAVLTELIVLLFRITVIYLNRERLNNNT